MLSKLTFVVLCQPVNENYPQVDGFVKIFEKLNHLDSKLLSIISYKYNTGFICNIEYIAHTIMKCGVCETIVTLPSLS